MLRLISSQTIRVFCLGVTFLAGAVGSRGSNVSLQVPEYTGGSPLVVSAAAFRSDGSVPGSFFFPFGGGYLRGTADNYGCVEAKVPLPDAVEVQSMAVSIFDNDATRSISVGLRRVDNFSGGTVTLASVTSSGSSGVIQVLSTSSISNNRIEYPDFSYYLTTCVTSPDLRLYSVQIYYIPDLLFADGFESGDTSGWTVDFP